MSLFKRKQSNVVPSLQVDVNIPGILLPMGNAQINSQALSDSNNQKLLDNVNKTRNFTVTTSADKTTAEELALRMGLDAQSIIDWNDGNSVFGKGAKVALQLNNELFRNISTSMDARKRENELRRLAQLEYIDNHGEQLRLMLFMNGLAPGTFTPGVDLNKTYALIINDTDNRELANAQAAELWRLEQSLQSRLGNFDNHILRNRVLGDPGLTTEEEQAQIREYLSNPDSEDALLFNAALQGKAVTGNHAGMEKYRSMMDLANKYQTEINGTEAIQSLQYVDNIHDTSNKAAKVVGTGAAIIGGAMALPVLLPELGGEWAANMLGHSAKYMILHPIESFIMPHIYEKGANKAFDIYENITGDKVSDTTRRITNTALAFTANPAVSNLVRGSLGKLVSGAETASTTAAQKYLYGLVTNGLNGSGYVGSKLVNGLHDVTLGAIGTAISESKYRALGDRSTSQFLQDQGMNSTLANGAEFVTDGLLYGLTGQLANRAYAKPMNNGNQLSDGAASPTKAVASIADNASGLFTTGRPAVDRKGHSYQLNYELSPRLVETQMYRKNPGSRSQRKSTLDGHDIYFNTYAGNDIKVGQNVGRGQVVTAKLRKGADAKTDDFMINQASRMANGAKRWGDGASVIAVKNQGSLELPGLAQMRKEGWTGLTRNALGELVEVPIDSNFSPHMTGAREDWVTVRGDGSGSALNVNGYNASYIKGPDGKVYEIAFDINGTGSASAGAAKVISGMADSGLYPMITYNVREAPMKAFVRRKSVVDPSPKLNTLFGLFIPKYRKAYMDSIKHYSKTSEGRLLGKVNREEARDMRKALQTMIDLLRK